MKDSTLRIALLTLLVITSTCALAQDVRYVSDKQFVPLRSGAGNEYRIVHRGIPSGTKLTVARTSADGEWSEITTDRGTSGWIRSQYLMRSTPAALKVETATAAAERAQLKSAELAAELQALKTARADLEGKLSNTGGNLDAVSRELAALKKISGKAVQLDTDNRRLVVEAENLRAEVDTLEAENMRLQDKVRSEDFLNGALSVLLGVVIALVVPRLVPKRRRNSEWA
ncbi:MAG: TIGR04211 family SH3 domain-containing protein [Halioglobus sp.]|nr:TIGR04211 family SH3 domain-containing protein [Halioglobus sp.]